MTEPNAPRGILHQSPGAAQDYAATRNLVAVVSKGMAGRERRYVEPLATTALMERTATLFKRLTDIDAFELELDAVTSDELVECVTALSGSIGGIDLGARLLCTAARYRDRGRGRVLERPGNRRKVAG